MDRWDEAEEEAEEVAGAVEVAMEVEDHKGPSMPSSSSKTLLAKALATYPLCATLALMQKVEVDGAVVVLMLSR